MRICGPKLSLCGLIISIWGIIQLVRTQFRTIYMAKIYNHFFQFQLLMGVFYYIHSVALVEDLPLEEHYASPEDFYFAADKAYQQVRNCHSCGQMIQMNHRLSLLERLQLLDRRLYLYRYPGRLRTAVLRQQPLVCQLKKHERR